MRLIKALSRLSKGASRWHGSGNHSPEHRTRRDISRPCLRLERLEDRALLSVGGSGDWGASYLPPRSNLFELGGYLTEPSSGAPLDIAMAYLTSHADQFGLSSDDVRHSVVTDQYVSPDTGMTHIYLRQELNGLPVVNANMNVNVTADGRVLNVGGGFVAGLSRLENTYAVAFTPILTASEAMQQTVRDLGLALDSAPIVSVAAAGDLFQTTTLVDSHVSLDPIPAQLQYVATGDGVELAWNYVLRTLDGQHWYDAYANSATGKVLLANDWVDEASYNVFAIPKENPDDGGRTTVTDPQDTTASPFGWHDTNGAAGAEFTDTRGNNVFAQDDWDANDTGGARPGGGSGLSFDFPLNLTQDPRNYVDAAVTNLFYWNNLLHDIHFRYGFNEVAGNFQQTNYSGSGLGSDPVQADAQDGEGMNNANFGTPPDGLAPRMQMFEFNLTNPDRDGDLDNVIIVHEYGHGVSNRLVGGPSNVNALDALQSGGMGEGWGDWYGLMFTQKSTDTKLASYPIGNYVIGQPATGGGIRRYPYNFNMAVDPLTYGVYNISSEVHDAGEIWASALWDVNWLLIDKYGFNSNLAAGYTGAGSAGNILALQLVMDSMKLMPANPTFLDGRDAMLLADQALTGGLNQADIWTAFARRGMGFSAYDGGNANATVVVEAFDLPNQDPMVLSSSPIGNAALPITYLTFYFNEPMNPASFVVAADVASFTGPGGVDLKPQITGFSWTNAKTLQINIAPQTTPGFYSVTIGPQILAADNGNPMNQDRDGSLGEVPDDRYTATFQGVVAIYSANMDANPGWTLDVGTAPYQWQYGTPAGVGGDPNSGHSGSNVVGYNLNGRYPDYMPATQYATTPEFSTIGYTNLSLGFWRWLGVESSSYDHANIQVWDGATWRSVWNHTGGTLIESSWSYQQYTLPAAVANKPQVKIRWGMGSTDVNVNYSGWNIDDVIVTGTAIQVAAIDFGDAPSPYPTLLANNGARHSTVSGLRLGSAVDGEIDGLPTANADGDDTTGTPDDEDGVVFSTPLRQNTNATVQVTALATGRLDAWIDFNDDGDWADAGEKVFNNVIVTLGTNNLVFPVPLTATITTQTFARFRLSSAGGLSYVGQAVDGEVEDYAVAVQAGTPGQIQGDKFNDLDGDGTRDAGEPTLAGWTIYLDTNGNATLDAGEPTQVTNASGHYVFADLVPATYTVREVLQSGWTQTSPTIGGQRLFEVRTSGTTATIYELNSTTGAIINSFPAPASIMFAGPQGLALGPSSLFYVDGSTNGPHMLWELNPSTGAVIDSDVVDWTSPAEIAGVAYLNGKVYLEQNPLDSILVWDPAGDTLVTTLTVAADLIGGLTGAADLGVLFDSNFIGDIFKIDPVTGAVLATLSPGVGGFGGGLAYVNRELMAGVFTVPSTIYRISPATGAVLGSFTSAGFGPLTALGGDGLGGDRAHWVVLTAGQVASGKDFGDHAEPARIEGDKFNDLDGDGTRDAGEPTLAGWTIYLDTDSDGTLDPGETSTITNAAGHYVFANLPPATYTVREVLQTGWTQTYPAGNGMHTVVLAVGEVVTGKDFGDFQNFQLVSLSGQKFNDLDGDGVKDAGEPALQGWTILLDLGDNGTVDQTRVTDANGSYSFTAIGPGTHKLAEVPQAGWTQTLPAALGTYSVTTQSGQDVTGIDFGNFRLVSLSGQKFDDLDGDGVKDAGEPGLQGWTIYLDTDNDGTLDAGEPTQVTPADGNYSFTAIGPGTHKLAEVAQAGWTQTLPAAPGTYSVTTQSGLNVTGKDFASRLPLIDILLQSVTTDGFAAITVAYTIATGAAPSFDIAFYKSANTAYESGDEVLDTVSVTAPADRTIGSHTLTFNIGSGANQVALPGAGAAETDSDYFLLAVADPADLVAETDLDPWNGNNTVRFAGVYHPAGGGVFVHGTSAGDTVTLVPATPSLEVTVNGTLYTYADADVTGLRIRTHEGADTVNGPMVGKPQGLFGGEGNDTLTGGAGNDTLVGGAGDDTLTGNFGNDVYLFDANAALGGDRVVETSGTDLFDFSATTAKAVALNLSLTTAQTVNSNLTLTLSSGSAIENVIGGALDDTIIGNGLSNVLRGGDGNDTLTGGAGNDTLVGGAGNDLYLFDADAALGSDAIDESGGGIDTLNFSATTTRSISVSLSSPAAQTVNSNLTLTLSSGATIENVIGGSQGDTLTGNALPNTLTGGAGNDKLTGGAGNDRLTGGAGNDALTGGADNDVYVFDADSSIGSDTINESSGGIDTLDFSATTTKSISVSLSSSASQTVNSNLTLTLSSGATIENVIGGSLGDTLTGNALANTLTGGAGNDTLTGGAGNDVYVFDADSSLGSDTINESSGGIDTLDFSLTTAQTVTINLSKAVAQVVNSNLTLTLSSGSAIENVIGGALDDTIIGNGLSNVLRGGAGNDVLLGGAGNDAVFGDDGSDILFGGSGVDTLWGGLGDDLLVGGTTSYHDEATGVVNLTALTAVMNEWKSGAGYSLRVDHILNGGGLNVAYKLDSSTVFPDAAADQLYGEAGQDWFFYGAEDTTPDLDLLTETKTLIP